MNEKLTKADVESIPLGGLTVGLYDVSDIWLGDNRVQKFTETLKQIIAKISSNTSLTVLVRAFIVTSDLEQEVKRWEAELEMVIGITKSEHGRVAGKVISWGNDEIESTYVIIILEETYALGAIIDQTTIEDSIPDDEVIELTKQMSHHLITHELGHAVWKIFRIVYKNEIEYSSVPGEWESLRRRLSMTYIEELFATEWANKHFSFIFEGDIDVAVEFIRFCKSSVAEDILRYRFHGDTGLLFQKSISHVETVAYQLARVIGACDFTESTGENREKEITEKAGQISLDWQDIVTNLFNLRKKATNLMELSNLELQNLDTAIEKLFVVNGLFPATRGDDIWLDVPFS